MAGGARAQRSGIKQALRKTKGGHEGRYLRAGKINSKLTRTIPSRLRAPLVGPELIKHMRTPHKAANDTHAGPDCRQHIDREHTESEARAGDTLVHSNELGAARPACEVRKQRQPKLDKRGTAAQRHQSFFHTRKSQITELYRSALAPQRGVLADY